jgi:hypothetical protein
VDRRTRAQWGADRPPWVQVAIAVALCLLLSALFGAPLARSTADAPHIELFAPYDAGTSHPLPVSGGDAG